jgi:predicted RNA-binding Zn ribbon-like protein
VNALWIDLINSDWHDYLGRGRDGRDEDRLENPRWLRRFLARWGLPSLDVTDGDTGRALRELRSLLQRLVGRAAAGKSPRDSDLAALNSYLAAGPVVRHLERDKDAYRVRLVPLQRATSAVLAEIASSFTEVLVEGDPSRIKICQNPDCTWVFYDGSRNRTRRWCEGPTGCGNLLKVRRFRERRRAGRGKTSTDAGARRRRRS